MSICHSLIILCIIIIFIHTAGTAPKIRKNAVVTAPTKHKTATNDECPICLDEIKQGQASMPAEKLPNCEHHIHLKCIKQGNFKLPANACPICRAEVSENFMGLLRKNDQAGPSNSKTEQTKYDRQIALSLSHYDDSTANDAQIAEAMDKAWQEQADAELARRLADQLYCNNNLGRQFLMTNNNKIFDELDNSRAPMNTMDIEILKINYALEKLSF